MEHLTNFCFIIPSLSNGGAERVVSILASQLAKDGHGVVVIKYFETMHDYPIDDRVRVLCLAEGDEKDYHAIPFLKKIRKLRSLLKTANCEYVVPFLSHVSVHAFLAGMGLRHIKWVQTIRNAPNLAPASKPFRYLRNIIVAISYRTFVQTESQKRYFPSWLQKKIFVLPNPVSDNMFTVQLPRIDLIKKIVSVGRLTEQKNFSMLIQAAVNVSRSGRDIVLSIYGEGELRHQLQGYIDSLGCNKYCHLCGRSDNIVDVLTQSDLFVLSSNHEGLPNALMEAMSVGLPCIATDCETGPSDLIGPERGILVPVGDVTATTAAICKMIDDPQSAKNMGENAKAFMSKNYSPRIISQRFVEEVVLR